MSFTAPCDDLILPMVPEGKLRRLLKMYNEWWEFWYYRREKRFLEWGEFSDWGEIYFDAAGTTLATYFYQSGTGDYEAVYTADVRRGTPANPKAIDPRNQFIGGVPIVGEMVIEFDPVHWPDNSTTQYEVWCRWFMWMLYQIAVAECLYDFTHYKKRQRDQEKNT